MRRQILYIMVYPVMLFIRTDLSCQHLAEWHRGFDESRHRPDPGGNQLSDTVTLGIQRKYRSGVIVLQDSFYGRFFKVGTVHLPLFYPQIQVKRQGGLRFPRDLRCQSPEYAWTAFRDGLVR